MHEVRLSPRLLEVLMPLPLGLRAQAMQIAWEQVAHWETCMNATEASDALGLSSNNTWDYVARRLAWMWIELHHPTISRYRQGPEQPHNTQGVDFFTLTNIRAA